LGIDLQDNLVTMNDLLDPDKLANQELNFPVITGAVLFGGQTTISGTLDIDSNPVNAIVEIFSLNIPDPSGFGEGDNYLTQTVPAANGNWSVTVSGIVLGTSVSATTTDVNNNTSEFASDIAVTNTVNITVTTNPAGLSFSVDGIVYSNQQTFAWLPFTNHIISTTTPQNVGLSSRMNFSNWSDGGAISHPITTSLIPTTYVASFNTQYLLTTSVTPPGSGAIITSPAGPWFNAGDTATLTATPGPGFMFTVWGGNLSGNINPALLVMNSAKTVIANFVIAPVNVVSTIPSQNALDVNKISNILITFDQPISFATMTATTFSVYGHLKGYYSGTYSWDGSSKTATFNPTNNFADGEIISVSLTNGIKSVAGGTLNPYSFSFTVQASNPTKMAFMRSDQSVSKSGNITTADFNNDGWVDAAVYTWWDFDTKVRVGVMLNNLGTLQPPVNYVRNKNQYLSPGNIYSFDADRDNDVDIILTETNDAGGYMNIVVMKNNGNGTFATPLFYQASSSIDLAFADLNNDGFIDIIGNMVGDMYKVGVFLNDGTGKFNTSTTYIAGYYPKYPFTGDFNNDGYKDFAVIISPNNTYQIAVVLNNKNGTFGSPTTYPVNISQAMTLKGADFNADGYVDLVCCGDLGYRINVLMNNGNGTFGAQTEYPLPNTQWPKSIICTDIDGDKDIDILACTRESYAGNLYVFLNAGDGIFQIYLSTITRYLEGRLSFADFDNDGDIDPVLFDAGGWVSIFRNTGVPEIDFGDTPDPSYPTLLINNGARHVKNNLVNLGTSIDAESDGQPDSQAKGDDLNGVPDDEDGVVFSYPLIPGAQNNVVVTYKYWYNSYGFLSAWIDFNSDGDWKDTGEEILTQYVLNSGVNTVTIPFSIPANAKLGNTFARFRIGSLPYALCYGQAPDGEVEDYKIVVGKFDFGDAPDPAYPTLLANNGARHIYDGATWLGANIDPEPDGLPNANALGDDNSSLDDEDGVIFTNTPTSGATATIQVTASVAGKLNAWLDYNADGDWADAGEQIFTNTGLTAGVNNLSFAIPSGVVADTTFARFRFDTSGGLSYTGAANNGEVEDYMVVISPASTTWSDGFEGYALNSDIVGQGGWGFWGGASSSSFARITNAQAYSGGQSLKIRGVTGKETADDIVHPYSGCTTGVWIMTIWQYIPVEAAGGTTYLVLLNQYDPGIPDYNWSTQLKFDPDQNIIESEFDNITLPLIKGSWVKICVTIDLGNDLQTISYNGQHLITKSWTNGMNSSGILNIAAVDLFANTLANVDVYYDDVSLRLLETQNLELNSGWGGFSDYIEPADPGVDVMFGPVEDKLFIIYNQTGLYWPGQNLNTLGNYDVYSGYALKMTADASLSVSGDKITDKTVDLSSGWNLMPVLSEEPCDIETLFEGIPGFSLAKELAGTGVYWKEFQVNTIGCLLPGKAYYVRMTEAGSIDFSIAEGCEKSGTSGNTFENKSPWNAVVNTPNSHLIAFNLPENSFEPGDIIGGFTSDGLCAGITRIADKMQPFTICLNSDDEFADGIDGFEIGDVISFKIYKASSGETFDLMPTYNNAMNCGIFEKNGLSEVTSVTLATTGSAERMMSHLKVSPNPSHGIFNIEGANIPARITIYNAFGGLVFSEEVMLPVEINLESKPKGVYFIKVETENTTYSEKLIIQ